MTSHRIRILLVLSSLLLCLCPLLAATSDALAKDPVTGLTADQAVKLGQDRFIERYLKITGDKTTASMSNSALTYAHLRRYINDRGAAKRPKAQQAIIDSARTLSVEIMQAYFDIDETSGGGGSIKQVEWASGMIDMEVAIGRLILSMEKPKANTPARTEAEKLLTSLITGIDTLPKATDDGPLDAKLTQEKHDAAVKQLRSLLPQFKAMLKSVPDNGALVLVRCISASNTTGD